MNRLFSAVCFGASAVLHAPSVAAQKSAADSMSPLGVLRWRSVGPASVGGRISDIAVPAPGPGEDWSQGSVIYIAAATGGIWKTVDRGVSWIPVFEDQGTLAVFALAIPGTNPNVVWAGTGDVITPGADPTAGRGVFKSDNGGTSWTHVGFEKSEQIGRIAIDPTNENIVFVGVMGSPTHPDRLRGLYRTTDGGKTWKQTLAIDEWTGVVDIAIDPANPQNVFASGFHQAMTTNAVVTHGKGAGIYKSTDGGVSWKRVDDGLPKSRLGRIGLSVSPARTSVVYAIIDPQNEYGAAKDPKAESPGLYRSDDHGETWKRGANSDAWWYFSRLFADPRDPDRVYSLATNLVVSNDGGSTVKIVNGPHVDYHAFWIDPNDSRHLIAGNDGGLWQSYDAGAHWFTFYNLPISHFYKVGVDVRDPYYIYGGLQDNNFYMGPSRTRTTGIVNTDWVNVGGGDAFHALPDPEDSNTVYVELGSGATHRYDVRSGEARSTKRLLEIGEKREREHWGVPTIISPHDHRTLYRGGMMLFRSADRGENWTRISDTLGIAKLDTVQFAGMRVSAYVLYGTISAISESPLQKGVLYVGVNNGRLHISRDDGKTWRSIKKLPGVPDGTPVSAVMASRLSAGTAYIALCGVLLGDWKPYILKTTDFGENWSPVTTDLPNDASVRSLLESARQPNLLFAGTEVGVFAAIGSRWRALQSGLPRVSVRDMALQHREGDLVAGTWGRGIYVLQDITALEDLAAAEHGAKPAVFAVKPATMYIERVTPQFPSGHEYTATNPPSGSVITYYLPKLAPTSAVGLSILDGAGKTIRKLEATRKEGLNRVVWDFRTEAPYSPGASLHAPPMGLRVAPGSYVARLTVTDQTPIDVPVLVRADPLGLWSPVADSVFADERLIERINDRLQTVNHVTGTVKAELDEAIAMMARVHTGKSVTRIADSLSKIVGAIADSLSGKYSGDGDEQVVGLSGALTPFSSYGRGRAAATLSASERKLLTDVSEIVERIAARLNSVITGLPTLRQRMDDAGVPWTRNRRVK